MNKIFWLLRLISFYILVSAAAIFFSIVGIICIPLPFRYRYWIITRWSHFFIICAKYICGLKYRVHGLENLPKVPSVVLCNHQSAWETIFMQVLLPAQSWVLKKELLKIPFFGWGLALLNPIAIDRKNFYSAKILIEYGCARLNQGFWVLIYPEGTRVLPGVDKNYSRTGAALAIAANVPIIPIAHNAGYFWPKGFWIKHPGIIDVVIGSTILPNDSNNDALEITKSIKNWIKQHIYPLKKE